MKASVRFLAIAATATAALLWFVAGLGAVFHLPVYLLVVLPGIPIGIVLFGRHPVGVLAGAALGYAMSALALSTAEVVGAPPAGGFLAAWAAGVVVCWLAVVRLRPPHVELPPWTASEYRGTLVVLAVALAIYALPYRNLGRADAEGTKHYRAYFTADFLWHMALTAELANHEHPPANPYMADQPLHYYWTYFVVPATVATTGPRPLRDIERVLKANAALTGTLMLLMFFGVTWAAVPNAKAATVAVILSALAASAEGVFAMADFLAHGQPLSVLREMNIDAVSNWYFSGLRIDGVPRSMWYTPQHAMAVTLGLVALPIAGRAGLRAPMTTVLLAGLFLGAATLFNPLLGGMFSLIYGLSIAIEVIVQPGSIGRLFMHAAAALPVLLAIWWSTANHMFEGAGAALQFGARGFARNAPFLTLALSLGPLLFPSIAALCWPTRIPREVRPAIIGVLAGLSLLYFVRLSVEESYVGFRGGQIVLATLPTLAALAFARGLTSPHASRLVAVGVAVLFAVGLPTTVIDAYNAQDTDNRRIGPGFRWTISVPQAEQEAFAWIRRTTARTAIVQMDPIARARDTWTQIPTFAQRRMAAGLPISLMHTSDMDRRSNRIHQRVYSSTDAADAWFVCDAMGIKYVYVGSVERVGNRPAGLAKFDNSPKYFKSLFRNAEATIYAVLPP